MAPGTVACCRQTRSLLFGKQTSCPALVSQITLLKISCATLCTSEAAGLGHPPSSHRLCKRTNPGALPEVTPPSWKGSLRPKAGRARLGKEPALCQEALDLAIFYQVSPPPQMLPAARPSSWQSGDRPGSWVPPSPTAAAPRLSYVASLASLLPGSLFRKGAGDREAVNIWNSHPTPFQRDGAAMSPVSPPPLLLLFLRLFV